MIVGSGLPEEEVEVESILPRQPFVVALIKLISPCCISNVIKGRNLEGSGI